MVLGDKMKEKEDAAFAPRLEKGMVLKLPSKGKKQREG